MYGYKEFDESNSYANFPSNTGLRIACLYLLSLAQENLLINLSQNFTVPSYTISAI